MNHEKEVRLAWTVLNRSRHVCVFYHSQGEEYQILLPFIKEGFERGVKFGARAVVDILRCHPMAIIGGIMQENPFYVPPNELLRELQERRGQPATADERERHR